MTGESGTKFDDLIGLNLLLLKLCGVILSDKGMIAGDTLACLAFACLSIVSVSYTYEFVVRGAYSGTALVSFAMIISLVGGQSRFTILFLYRDRCQRMLNVCKVLWSTLEPREQRPVRHYARKINRLTAWYLSSCYFTIFFYIIASLLASFTSDEAKNNRHLPYAFFVDVQVTPWYEIAYVLQLFIMLNITFICVGTDTIGPLFILIVSGHFDALKSRIERLNAVWSNVDVETVARQRSWTMEKLEKLETPSNKQMNDLRVCLTYHRMLLE